MSITPIIPFPQNGSQARCAGLIWTIYQRERDGSYVLFREGFNRRATIDEMEDPAADQLNIAGLGRIGIAQMVWLNGMLRDANAVIFRDLLCQMQAAAHRGEVPTGDRYDLMGRLRRLGWEPRPRPAGQHGDRIWQRIPVQSAQVAA